MLSVFGTYKDGKVIIEGDIKIETPVKVIITFLEKINLSKSTTLKWSDFHFDESQELLKEIKGNISDEVSKERREE